MEITRKSVFTGITSTMDLDVTEDQLYNYENGELLQNAFPNLPAEEREFIKTGVTPKEWNDMFGSK
ncbi:MAG: hypothetical protein ACTSQL_07675 [Promethearchaeota archaeon]